MTLVLVEVPNEAAVAALGQQPGVRVVGVVAEAAAAPATQASAKPSVAGLIGSLSLEAGERMLRDTTNLRDEWERESY